MQLKKTELALAGLTVAFVFFILGYYSGQNSAKGTFSVKTRLEAGPSVSAEASAAPSEGGDVSAAPSGTDGANAGAPESAGEASPAGPDRVSASPAAQAPSESSPININTADADRLMQLPGIGEVLAGRIVEYRNRYGAFKDTREIMEVKGIGEATYAKIQNLITVG